MPANIAVWTTAMTSPASAPIMVKPRMRSPPASTSVFMKPRVSGYCPRSQHGGDWQLRHANGDALALGFAFAQANARERRVGEHAVRDEPITLGASPAAQIGRDDTEIVERDVGELWAAGGLANRQNIGRARLEPVIDRDISAV